MRKIYIDKTEEVSCTAVYMRDTEIIQAGTTIYSMPVKDKNAEYQKFADKYDIHFIFEDSLPEIDFYTIPRVDIMAVDSCGGYIGTIGEICDLKSDAPICYLDRNRNCYLIAENGKDFLKTVNSWKTQLKPYDEVIFYHSKEEAKKNHEFLDMSTITTVETDDSQKIPT
ncbi:hypothetical protein [Diplocloster modestus]|uniref:Uncharacterized protein n=1 Tax=Diplocloster modestus TaxID=2850322 RepID=A0ABS6KE26_9FIRM|nr:hypothetical protein [Diplocloster modestus]MBU9728743.1 hypothetical protein [Diplocloster modestus]